MMDKIKALLLKFNEKGIPLPLLMDRGKGSYTLTMFVISFNLTIILNLGKVTKLVGEVDFYEMMALTGMMGGFYLGRKYQADKKGNISIDSEQVDQNQGENK